MQGDDVVGARGQRVSDSVDASLVAESSDKQFWIDLAQNPGRQAIPPSRRRPSDPRAPPQALRNPRTDD